MRRSGVSAGYGTTHVALVLGVVAVLIAALVPLVIGQIETSRIAEAESTLNEVKAGFSRYHDDTGFWPCDWSADQSANYHGALERFSCVYEDDGLIGWSGPYVDTSAGPGKKGRVVAATREPSGSWRGLVDPWGRPYRLFAANRLTPGAPSGAIVVYSAGADGEVDTSETDLLRAEPTDDDVVLVVTQTAVP